MSTVIMKIGLILFCVSCIRAANYKYCIYKGKIVPEGLVDNTNPCEPVYCVEGVTATLIIDCIAFLNCTMGTTEMRLPGKCCPECVPDTNSTMPYPTDTTSMLPGCYENGKFYKFGPIKSTPCLPCTCQESGEVQCLQIECRPIFDCPPGTTGISLPGQCCPECVPVTAKRVVG